MTDDAAALVLPDSSDVPPELGEQAIICKRLAESDIVAPHFRGRPGNVYLAITAAQGLNVPLFTAMQEFHVVKGKVGSSAKFVRALALRAGCKIRTEVETDEVGRPVAATVKIARPDDPGYWHEGRFSLRDAEHAGLCTITEDGARARSDRGDPLPWEAYTRAMLVARATTVVAREAIPDILCGLGYTPDEIGGTVADADLEV